MVHYISSPTFLYPCRPPLRTVEPPTVSLPIALATTLSSNTTSLLRRCLLYQCQKLVATSGSVATHSWRRYKASTTALQCKHGGMTAPWGPSFGGLYHPCWLAFAPRFVKLTKKRKSAPSTNPLVIESTWPETWCRTEDRQCSLFVGEVGTVSQTTGAAIFQAQSKQQANRVECPLHSATVASSLLPRILRRHLERTGSKQGIMLWG